LLSQLSDLNCPTNWHVGYSGLGIPMCVAGERAGEWVRERRERDPLAGSLLDQMRDPSLCPTCLPILSSARDWVTVGTAFVAAEAAVVVAIEVAPVVAEALGPSGSIVGKGSWLSQGQYFRIGWSRFGGNYTFRVAGKIVDFFAGKAGAHW